MRSSHDGGRPPKAPRRKNRGQLLLPGRARQQGNDQELVLFYAVSVFLSLLAGLVSMALFSHRDRRPWYLTLNIAGSVVVAFTLVANLTRGLPLTSLPPPASSLAYLRGVGPGRQAPGHTQRRIREREGRPAPARRQRRPRREVACRHDPCCSVRSARQRSIPHGPIHAGPGPGIRRALRRPRSPSPGAAP